MNERIKELADEAAKYSATMFIPTGEDGDTLFVQKFAELIIKDCIGQVEQAKNSPFISLDDANRMKHFVDVTKKKIVKHFGIES